jgi:UPF0716 protein FxsA
MRIFLFVAFVAVPIAEIFLFLQVGSVIGIPATIGLVILTAIAGTMLVRSQGLEVISKIRKAADQGEAPVDALVQGACVLVAGVLLLTPGFATDAFGFALLIPPIRSLITGSIWKLIQPHIVTASVHETVYREHDPRTSKDSVIIEGEAIEVDKGSDKDTPRR